ncbi:MAG: response regulator transcription factor [Bacteroidetes bacterium]|nr:response regulator transcription factor [Bacteroidota bacterium]
MNPIRCLVVDDEELARKLLENFINRLPHLELVEMCKNPLEAIHTLERSEIDLMFLDIQMPELTGIEFLKTLQQKPVVVFTTAYPEYALEGYQLDVIDYLLKPFSFERFVQAVNKSGELIKLKKNAGNRRSSLIEESPKTIKKDYLLVKSEHRVHKIRYADILYIQSMREYVAFYVPKGRILSLYSLKKLETELPVDQFLRIHKSYIVAIDKVTTLEGNRIHAGAEKLPIGNSYREKVLKRIF